jgi:hypothetical protein
MKLVFYEHQQLASSHPGFLAWDFPGKSLETTWLGFDRGALALV